MLDICTHRALARLSQARKAPLRRTFEFARLRAEALRAVRSLARRVRIQPCSREPWTKQEPAASCVAFLRGGRSRLDWHRACFSRWPERLRRRLADHGGDATAMRWWNSLGPEQMVAALFGDDATPVQEAAAQRMYADLDAATRMLVDEATAEIYGKGRPPQCRCMVADARLPADAHRRGRRQRGRSDERLLRPLSRRWAGKSSERHPSRTWTLSNGAARAGTIRACSRPITRSPCAGGTR